MTSDVGVLLVSDTLAGSASAADSPSCHDKPCTICGTRRQVLVRCQIDESAKWHFVCAGKCWKDVSGGVEDAKGHESDYPFYRYGGMWKNKHADGPMSAKKPKKVKDRQKREAAAASKTESKAGTAEEEEDTAFESPPTSETQQSQGPESSNP